MKTINIDVDFSEILKEVENKFIENFRRNFTIKPKYINGILYSVVYFKGEETNLVGTFQECEENIKKLCNSN
ncbi:MAG: hypothetical protein ACRDAG_01335 [Cetobacterium somerae]|uniref:hypothetical protein n=1 Tax=Cetobacterium somerae TaxID=188913 RepID=UPI003F31E5FE